MPRNTGTQEWSRRMNSAFSKVASNRPRKNVLNEHRTKTLKLRSPNVIFKHIYMAQKEGVTAIPGMFSVCLYNKKVQTFTVFKASYYYSLFTIIIFSNCKFAILGGLCSLSSSKFRFGVNGFFLFTIVILLLFCLI